MIDSINTSVFREFPVLKTDRLLLRDIQLSDAQQIFNMRSNNQVNRFIARNAMTEAEDAEKLVQRTRDAFTKQMAIGWAGILRDNQKIIGTCGFNTIDAPNLRAEIGGELSVDFWGKSIAIEAVTAIIKFGLETIRLHSIEAKVAPDNRGAIYLLEKSGFVKEAHFHDRIYFNGKYLDMAIYTLIKGRENYTF